MIHFPTLIQVILNLTEIEALPKYIRNKSFDIQNLFSAEIPALLHIPVSLSSLIQPDFDSIYKSLQIAPRCSK